jgi:PAS domain S-box-containing protein
MTKKLSPSDISAETTPPLRTVLFSDSLSSGADFLTGGGNMEKIIRAHDWSKTSLGPFNEWPQSLKTSISIVLNSSFPMFIWWGENELINFYNDAYAVILGEKHPYALGRSGMEAWIEIWDDIGPLAHTVFTAGTPVHMQDLPLTLNRHGYAEFTNFTFSYSPIRDETGAIAGLYCTCVETTTEVIGKQKLAESEERLKLSLDSSGSIGTWIWDTVNDLVIADARFAKLYSVDPEAAAIGVPIAEFIKSFHPDDLARVQSEIETAMKTGDEYRSEYRIIEPDGSIRWVLARGKCNLDAAGKPMQFPGLVIDITESKKAEEALREAEERFRTLADNIQNLAWMANPDGWIFWYNKRWYDYTGTTFEQMQGWGWEKVHHPDHVKNVTDFVKRAWLKGASFELSFPLRSKDGSYRWFLTRAEPILDTDGNVERWIGTNTDIEDLKQRHAMEHRVELITEQRNALMEINKTKDEFIALASHQLRTPATAVKQYVGMLLGEYFEPLTPDQCRYLQVAYDSNERELRIIDDLLKTAQIDSSKYTLEQQRHDIVVIMNECIKDFKSDFKSRNQTIALTAPSNSLTVAVDAVEMKLVFANLLENASKYSHHNTQIKVCIEEKGTHAQITVADRGVGIRRVDQQRIFDKFTRVDNELSDTVTGSGLGLYWVKRIIELHQGTIKLTSKLANGSTFTVRLPL